MTKVQVGLGILGFGILFLLWAWLLRKYDFAPLDKVQLTVAGILLMIFGILYLIFY